MNAALSSPVELAREGAIATLRLNRPDSLNTLDFAMMDSLVEHTSTLASDDEVRVVIVRGAGRHFMAGGDIRTFASTLESTPDERRARFLGTLSRLHSSIENLHRMPAVAIAGLHGAVAGFGLSLACACDLAIAADDAYFASAYRNIALTSDGGGTWTLPRIVGVRKTMEILLTGERFDAAEAARLGIVNRVVPAAELDATLDALARNIADGPRPATQNIKRLVRESLGRTLSEQLQAEATSIADCAASADFAEGIRAFLAKRPARFGS
jgi:2-(1,2-epoxy-1,2-dihydrophenyl)acetyl-CoA isomerase